MKPERKAIGPERLSKFDWILMNLKKVKTSHKNIHSYSKFE